MPELENEMKNNEIRQSILRRLVFIESRLYWEGHINRSNLMRRFGISMPQASTDISLYSSKAAENLGYDTVKKTYVAAAEFKPIFYQPSTQNYLSQLHACHDGTLEKESSILGHIPDYVPFSVPQRLIKPQFLRKVLSALKERKMLEIFYESFSQGEIAWRWISPHALAFANDRWVLRAYCHKRELFRDFVLGRITDVGKEKNTTVNSAQDENWNSVEIIQLKPNPALLPAQQKIVENDYQMKDGSLNLTVRRSLLYYLYHNLGFHKSDDKSVKSDAKDKLILVNREKIEAIIFNEQSVNYPHKVNDE